MTHGMAPVLLSYCYGWSKTALYLLDDGLMKTDRYVSFPPPRNKNAAAPRLHASGGRVTRAIILAASALWTAGLVSCATISSMGVSDPYAGRSWAQIREGLCRPEQVEDYLRCSTVRYRAEKAGVFNHTQTPDETLRLRAGDCEDFACLIVDALGFHGYEARILSVEAETRGGLLIHAVGVYRDGETGRWHYIHAYDFKGLSVGVSEGFGSERDMAAYIAGKMGGKLYQYFVMTPERFTATYDRMTN